MDHCVMNIVPSSDMDKNVNWNVVVKIHTDAHMSLENVSANQVSKKAEIFVCNLSYPHYGSTCT